MSVKVSDRVWKHSKATGSALLLLLAMADLDRDAGEGVYAKQKTLATMTRLSVRQVGRLIDQLEAMKEISVEHRKGQTDLIAILVGPDIAVSEVPPRTSALDVVPTPDIAVSGTSDILGATPDIAVSDKPYEPSLSRFEAVTSKDAAQAQQMRTNEERGRGTDGTRPSDVPRRVPPGTSAEDARKWRDRFAIRNQRWPTEEEELRHRAGLPAPL